MIDLSDSSMYDLFRGLAKNTSNFIVYYDNRNKRVQQSFRDFSLAVDAWISRLNVLNAEQSFQVVAILGPVSFGWARLDMACLKGGYKTVALPESVAEDKIKTLLKETNADIVFLDYSLKEKYPLEGLRTLYFNCPADFDGQNLENVPGDHSTEIHNFDIPEEYSTIFSSGTSGDIKKIRLRFNHHPPKRENKGIHAKLKLAAGIIRYKLSFWSRRDNKVLLFMPFSHVQQRTFFNLALLRGINIVLSDPTHCLMHIIKEKPNIMISVPIFYDLLANAIKAKIEKFKGLKKMLFAGFNRFRINSLGNVNPLKRFFSWLLFPEIEKIYGGRADFFVTGSAPSKLETMKTFYSIGIKIYEAYGQTESGFISMNTPGTFRFQSVGKPITPIKIAADSEILVKFNDIHLDKEVAKPDSDGYVHTGDLGYLDKDGFLFLTGRKDEVLVFSNGKKVFPRQLESKFENFEFIEHALVFSSDNYNISLILSPSQVLRKNGVLAEGKIKKAIGAVNRELPEYEKIKNYLVTAESFSVTNNLMTANFKLKRNEIVKKYAGGDFIFITDKEEFN